MTINDERWEKLEPRIEAIWRELRPNEEVMKTEAQADDDRAFYSKLGFGDGVEFLTCIVCYLYDEDWVLRAEGHFFDRRARILEEQLGGPNPVSDYVTKLDVAVAHSFLKGKAFDSSDPDYAPLDLRYDAPDSEIKAGLERNIRQLDEIWFRVGGDGLSGFEQLALWVLRNKAATGAGFPTHGMPCAALVYGDRKLARWWLQEYEITRFVSVRAGFDTYTREPNGEIRSDVAKLMAMLEMDDDRHP